jgi:hypothetical protein
MMMPSPTTRARFGIGGGSDVPIVRQRLQHFPERADAALAVKGADDRRNPDGSHAEPLGAWR